VAIVGKYLGLADSYKSLIRALKHAGIKTRTNVALQYIDAEKIEQQGAETLLADVSAILVPGGFGKRGVEGKIAAVGYARKHNIPYFGICLGLQVAVIEFARNKVKLANAHSTEFAMDTAYPVIGLITEWKQQDGNTTQRDEHSDKGGTMRLGGYECALKLDTLAFQLYGQEKIVERHRHRYEVNDTLIGQLEECGLVVSGRSSNDSLVEMIELPDHPWFVACQSHPEFTSTPREGHPVFIGYIEAARKYRTF